MTLNIVYRAEIPPITTSYALVCVPTLILPNTLGALRLKSAKYFYASEGDYQRGSSLVAELSGDLLMSCAVEITNAIDRVYNLLDASLNGIGRSVSGSGTEADPYAYTPALVQAPDPEDYNPGGLRADTNATRALLDNLVNGTTSPVASDSRSFRQQLEDIYTAIVAIEGEEGPTAEQVAQVISILGAL